MKMIYPIDNTPSSGCPSMIVGPCWTIALGCGDVHFCRTGAPPSFLHCVRCAARTFGCWPFAAIPFNTLTCFALVWYRPFCRRRIGGGECDELIMKDACRPATPLKSMQEITGALIPASPGPDRRVLPWPSSAARRRDLPPVLDHHRFGMTLSIDGWSWAVAVALPTLLSRWKRRTQEAGLFFNGSPQLNHSATVSAAYRLVPAQYWTAMIAYAGIVAVLAFLFVRLPTGFSARRGPGLHLQLITLPAAPPSRATLKVAQNRGQNYLDKEKSNVDFIFSVAGFSFSGSGENTGLAFTHLKDWSERKGSQKLGCHRHAP